MATARQKIERETGALLVTQTEKDAWNGLRFKEAWTPSTAYLAGDQVTNGGNTYRRKADGASGASFDTANWSVIAQGGSVADGSVTTAKLDPAISAQLAATTYGDINVGGLNKIVTAYGLTGTSKWDSKSGGQVANFSVTKVAASNVCSIRVVSTSSFADAAPQCFFSGTNRTFPFTSADELRVSVASSLAGNCMLNFEEMDASQVVIAGQAPYVQATNGNSVVYTTTNANVKYIRLVDVSVSFARVGSSNVATNFSGASDSTVTFGIYDKGYSVPQTLKAKITELVTGVAGNGADINTLKNGYGSTCRLQLDKGKYQFPTSLAITTTSGLNAVYDASVTRFARKSIRFEVVNTASVDQDGYVSRGIVTLQFPVFAVSKSLSFWIRVPSQYILANPRAGVDQKLSFAMMVMKFYNGSSLLLTKTVYTEYAFVAGWNLYKFTDDTFVGLTITSVTIDVRTYYRTPELVFWIDSLVVDQVAQPTLLFSMDNDMDDKSMASGWGTYVKNNAIPMSLRVYLNATNASSAGRQLVKQLYERGQLDQGAYSGSARTATSYAAAVDYLKNDPTYGRLTILNRGFAARDLIESHNATNYLDDALMTQEIEAGFRLLRTTNAYSRSNYVDEKSPAIPCISYGNITSLAGITDAYIAAQIDAGKAYIDALIKYGSYGWMMSHQIVSRTLADSTDVGLASLYEVYVGIFDYALTKVAAGELTLMTPTNLYRNCVI